MSTTCTKSEDPGRIAVVAWVVTMTISAAAAGFAQSPPAPPEAPAEAVGDTVDRERTMLRPGDVVRVQIWREPELSGEFTVDERGIVTFPKLGPRQVAGESFSELKQRLVEEYQRYLRNPAIEVVALRRVNVLGEVAQPGLYPVDLTTTVADALALAGGIGPDGNPDEIKLIRDGREQHVRLSQGMMLRDLPIQSGDQIYVERRSWLSRNSWGVFATAASLAVTLFMR